MSDNSTAEFRKLWPWRGHIALCALWFAAAFGLSNEQTGIDLAGFEATLLITMVPIVALIAHRGAVRRTMLLAALKPGSTFAGVLWGTGLRTFVAACLAAIIGALLVLQMLMPDTRQILFYTLAGQAVFVVLLLPLALSWLRQHFQPWSQVHVVQQLVVLAAGVAAAMLAVVLIPLPDQLALGQALETPPFPNAPLLDLLALSHTVVDGLQRMALVGTSEMGAWPKIFANFVYFVLWLPPFMASSAVFVVLGVRWSELRRAFAAPQPSDLPAPTALGAIIAASLTVAFFWGLHHYLVSPLDRYVGERQVAAHVREKIDVVRFGERYFRASAVQQVLAARPELSALKLQAMGMMCDDANKAFASARQGAAEYVDYYYTMPAVSMRMALAFVGNPSEYMKSDIQRRIFGTDFLKLTTSGAATVKQAEHMAAEVDRQWRARATEILKQHEVLPSNDLELNIVLHAPDLGTLLTPPGSTIDPRWQGATAVASALLAQGGMDAVAGRASRAISNTQAIQSVLSRIAKAAQLDGPAKAYATFVAKGAARAASAVVGAGAATLTGAGLTKVLLEADEAINRGDFEKQILGEVETARIAFLKSAQCPA